MNVIEIDFQSICRLCLGHDCELVSIYDTGIHQRIQNYLPIKISPEETLPSQICLNCSNTLDNFHDLYISCQLSNNKLLQITFDHTPDGIILDDNDAVDKQSLMVDFEEAVNEIGLLQGDKFLEDLQLATENENQEEDMNMINDESDKLSLETDLAKDIDRVGTAACSTAIELHENGCIDEKEDESKVYKIEYIDDEVESVQEESVVEEIIEDEECFKTMRIPLTEKEKELLDQCRLSTDKRKYQCQECNKIIHSSYTFLSHHRIHDNIKPFSCCSCDMSFRDKNNLLKHHKRKHSKTNHNKLVCKLCGKSFTQLRNLQEHENIHTNYKPYKCEHDGCNKSFKQKASLYMHKKAHVTERKFICKICNQSFLTKQPLIVHMTIHDEIKKHDCSICGKLFRIKNELNKHLLIHTNFKQFKCSECPREFHQKRYAIKHFQKDHSGLEICVIDQRQAISDDDNQH